MSTHSVMACVGTGAYRSVELRENRAICKVLGTFCCLCQSMDREELNKSTSRWSKHQFCFELFDLAWLGQLSAMGA